MRRLILCIVLTLTAAPASAAGLARTGPATPSSVAPPSSLAASLSAATRIEGAAAKAQVDHDAFQGRILAAERRASASICVGCLVSETARPAARPVVHTRTSRAQASAKLAAVRGEADDLQ